jgi:hypothetical protein
MLPSQFNQHCLLPPKDYEVSFSQLRKSLLVLGPVVKSSTWDMEWRGHLVDNLEIMVKQLWRVGIENIYIDGSFLEDKDHPGDIDGYFECKWIDIASGRLEQELNLLDPPKVWTWDPKSRRIDLATGTKQLPMWHMYHVELYPHYYQLSGITDKYGNELMFPAAFRQSTRENTAKGIVKIKSE